MAGIQCCKCLLTVIYVLLTCTQQTFTFKVFWNAPSFMCRRAHKININLEKFGIIVNDRDDFNGNHVTIFYEHPLSRQLGAYPHLTKDGREKYGGSPLKSNWNFHRRKMRGDLNRIIPLWKHDNGIAIIDWESWVPLWYQNTRKVRNYTQDVVASEYKTIIPWKSTHDLRRYTRQKFEVVAQDFLSRTLRVAQKSRRNRLWGYYAMPRCPKYNLKAGTCDPLVRQRNDGLIRLMAKSGALYPAAYFPKRRTTEENRNFLKIQAEEVKRLRDSGRRLGRGRNPPIYLYVTFGYREMITKGETLLYNEEDLRTSIQYAAKLGLDGVIIWGSSIHFASKERCEMMEDYVYDLIGPISRDAIQYGGKSFDSFMKDKLNKQKQENDYWSKMQDLNAHSMGARNKRSLAVWSEEERVMPNLHLDNFISDSELEPSDEFSMHFDPNEIPIPPDDNDEEENQFMSELEGEKGSWRVKAKKPVFEDSSSATEDKTDAYPQMKSQSAEKESYNKFEEAFVRHDTNSILPSSNSLGILQETESEDKRELFVVEDLQALVSSFSPKVELSVLLMLLLVIPLFVLL